jgi:hypothetical protein
LFLELRPLRICFVGRTQQNERKDTFGCHYHFYDSLNSLWKMRSLEQTSSALQEPLGPCTSSDKTLAVLPSWDTGRTVLPLVHTEDAQ